MNSRDRISEISLSSEVLMLIDVCFVLFFQIFILSISSRNSKRNYTKNKIWEATNTLFEDSFDLNNILEK